jgi:uncharacterized GH25 family protein
MVWERQAGDTIPAQYTFKLGNGIAIGGRVVNESNTPIAGATINCGQYLSGGEVMARRDDQSEFGTRSTHSDAEGLWRVKGVPADLLASIEIRASHPDYVDTSDFGQRGQSGDRELRAGTFKVVLRRGSSVAGRVIDEIGDPIAGATITAGKNKDPGTQETKTDARGTFAFRNLRLGEIQFSALAKGRKPEIRTVEVKPDMPGILFRLGRGQKVWGIVKAESGEPVAGVLIALESEDGRVSDTYQLELHSGQDGRFKWDGAPDTPLNFSLLKKGYEAKRQQALKPNEENVITMRHARKIEGQVLDATTGQPVTKFRAVIGYASGAEYFHAEYAADPGMKDYADANGRFTVEVSEEVYCAVKAEADDYAAQIERLPEAQNGVVQVVLRLKPSASLRGVLVTADGAPAAGATVAISTGQSRFWLRNARLEDMSRERTVVTTDAAGEFVLPSPPEGGRVVAADEKGFGSASIPEVRDSGRLVLQAFGRVEGTYTRRGQPVAGQQFEISMSTLQFGVRLDRVQYQATTDESGRFTLERVPPGEAWVALLANAASPFGGRGIIPSYRADVTVLPGQTAQVAVDDSGATLTGHIRFEPPLAEGEKLSLTGGLLAERSPDPPSMSLEQARAYSQTPEGRARSRPGQSFEISIAEDGSWSADSIPPGTYQLWVEASKGGSRLPESLPVARRVVQVVVPERATPQTQITVDEVILRRGPRSAGQEP